MPGRVEDDFVAAIAEAVMGVKNGLVLVGFKSPALQLFGSEQLSKFAKLCLCPRCSFAMDGAHQRLITKVKVVTSEWRGLV